jgi:hypothetical protein
MYEQMDAHLSSTSCNPNLPIKIQCAASAGREKLLKYKALMVTNQYYILGTSTSKIRLSIFFRLTD